MKIPFTIPLLIIALLFIGVLVYSQRTHLLSLPNRTITPTPSTAHPSVTQPLTSPTTKITPTPAPEANIKVYAPRTTDSVGPTFAVSGEARVFENTLQVRVTNPDSREELFSQPVTAKAPDVGQFGPFTVEVDLSSFNLQKGDDLLLEVFQYSAKDGSEIDKVQIPLVY